MGRQTTHSSGCGAWHVECWLSEAKWKDARYAMGDPAAVRHVEGLLAENERLRDAITEAYAMLKRVDYNGDAFDQVRHVERVLHDAPRTK
jgi:hypothetical protein